MVANDVKAFPKSVKNRRAYWISRVEFNKRNVLAIYKSCNSLKLKTFLGIRYFINKHNVQCTKEVFYETYAHYCLNSAVYEYTKPEPRNVYYFHNYTYVKMTFKNKKTLIIFKSLYSSTITDTFQKN